MKRTALGLAVAAVLAVLAYVVWDAREGDDGTQGEGAVASPSSNDPEQARDPGSPTAPQVDESAERRAPTTGDRNAERETVALAPASLFAHITDEAGVATGGVTVQLTAPDGQVFTAESDDEGNARLSSLPAEIPLRPRLLVDDELRLSVLEPLVLKSREKREVAWRIFVTCRLVGIVLDVNAAPVADQELILTRPRVFEPAFFRSPPRGLLSRTTSDADGRFSFEEVPPGEYLLGPDPRRSRVVVLPDGMRRIEPLERPVAPIGRPIVVPGGVAEHEVEITVYDRLRIHGKIVFPDGEPAGDVLLLATSDDLLGSLRADSDEKGTFDFGPVGPGTYDVFDNGGPDGWGLFEPVQVEPSEEPLRLVLQQGGALAGRAVLRHNGRAVDAWVTIRQNDASPRPGTGLAAQVGPKREGAFEFPTLQPASYDIIVQSEDLVWFGLLRDVPVAGGKPHEGAAVFLDEAARLKLVHSGPEAAEQVRARCFVGGKLYDSRSIRPNRPTTIAVPPGEIVVRFSVGEGKEHEEKVTLAAGKEKELTSP